MPKDKPSGAPPFEQQLARLEEIAGQLERGDLPLEQALALYEEGVGLSAAAERRLAEAEQRVKAVVGETGDGQPQLDELQPLRR